MHACMHACVSSSFQQASLSRAEARRDMLLEEIHGALYTLIETRFNSAFAAVIETAHQDDGSAYVGEAVSAREAQLLLLDPAGPEVHHAVNGLHALLSQYVAERLRANFLFRSLATEQVSCLIACHSPAAHLLADLWPRSR